MMLMWKTITHCISLIILEVRFILLQACGALSGTKLYTYWEQLADFHLHIVALMIYVHLHKA